MTGDMDSFLALKKKRRRRYAFYPNIYVTLCTWHAKISDHALFQEALILIEQFTPSGWNTCFISLLYV